jgi:putative flippase GtrA
MKEWLDKLFKAPTESTFIQLFRYGFVGGLAFLVDYGTLVLLTEFAGMHYLLAATISFILGLITNYLLSITWVFNQHKLNNRWVEFLLFAFIGVVGLGLNDAIMFLCTERCGIHYTLSKIIATAIVFFWNFLARKLILFKQSQRV